MTFLMRPLFSGSKGNCSYVEAGNARLLIDAGVSAKRLETALMSIGVEPASLDAILITHEHSDHIMGLNNFASRYNLRVYANGPTWQAMASSVTRLTAAQRVLIEPETDFYIKNLNVETFATSHDAASSMGYGFVAQGCRGIYLTDLGYISRGLLEKITGAQIILLECNHDEQMLLSGPYPEYLKKRIFSQKGHLSNRICGQALARLIPCGCKQAALMHLSAENNTPDLAYNTVCAILKAAGFSPEKDIRLVMGSQDGPVEALEIS